MASWAEPSFLEGMVSQAELFCPIARAKPSFSLDLTLVPTLQKLYLWDLCRYLHDEMLLCKVWYRNASTPRHKVWRGILDVKWNEILNYFVIIHSNPLKYWLLYLTYIIFDELHNMIWNKGTSIFQVRTDSVRSTNTWYQM